MIVNRLCRRSHTDRTQDGVPKAWSLQSSVCDLVPVTDNSVADSSASAVAELTYRIQTRSQARRREAQGSSQAGSITQQSTTPRPPSYGGSFVNLEFRIVVRPARATMFEFDPRDLHGSTQQFNRVTRACAFISSKYIHDAFLEAQKGPGVERGLSGTGADTE